MNGLDLRVNASQTNTNGMTILYAEGQKYRRILEYTGDFKFL